MTKPTPGSPDAKSAGCTCPVMDNAGGRGYMGQPDMFVVADSCPVHSTASVYGEQLQPPADSARIAKTATTGAEMRSASTIPTSQKPRIRAIARAAWIESGCDFDTACLLIDQRIPREIGGAWVMDAISIGHAFCVHWSQNQILEPAQVHVCGEPGSDFFESDEE